MPIQRAPATGLTKQLISGDDVYVVPEGVAAAAGPEPWTIPTYGSKPPGGGGGTPGDPTGPPEIVVGLPQGGVGKGKALPLFAYGDITLGPAYMTDPYPVESLAWQFYGGGLGPAAAGGALDVAGASSSAVSGVTAEDLGIVLEAEAPAKKPPWLLYSALAIGAWILIRGRGKAS